jgi:hypothetical protein
MQSCCAPARKYNDDGVINDVAMQQDQASNQAHAAKSYLPLGSEYIHKEEAGGCSLHRRTLS